MVPFKASLNLIEYLVVKWRKEQGFAANCVPRCFKSSKPTEANRVLEYESVYSARHIPKRDVLLPLLE